MIQLTTQILTTTINNYGTYKDLHFSKKEREEKLLQGIQSANVLKVRTGVKQADGTALALRTLENAIKKKFGKRLAVPLDFDFF